MMVVVLNLGMKYMPLFNFKTYFNQEEHPNKDLLPYLDCIVLKEKKFVEIRKGIPITQYVIFVKNEPVYCEKKEDLVYPPKEIQGYWIQEFPTDNEYYNYWQVIDNKDTSLISKFVKAKIAYKLKKDFVAI